MWFPKSSFAKESPKGSMSHPKSPLKQATCIPN